MKLFGFLNYIYIYIAAIFCSYSKGEKFTINHGQFRLLLGSKEEYSNNNNLTVSEHETFNTIINKLTFKAKNEFCELKDENAIKTKIIEILTKEDLFLAKDKKTGKLSIVKYGDGFQKDHNNCEFIFRDSFFGLGAIAYKSLYHIIGKDYKRKFLEIVLNYANCNFKNWNEFSGMLRNFIREVLNKDSLNVYRGDKSQLAAMRNFVGKTDKFFINFLCCYDDFSGPRYILDIKNFLTEVNRNKFVDGGEVRSICRLEMLIGDPKKVEFYSSSQDYTIKEDICKNIQICNFFEYNEKLDSKGIHKLLNGNDCDIFKDVELSFGSYLDKINVTTKDERYVYKRTKGKLKFVISNPNILQFVKNRKMLEDKEYYLDEIDNILQPFGNSITFKKSDFKDGGNFEIKIVKPIAGKVEYVKKNVKFELDWNLKDIYCLKIAEHNVKKKFQIDATYTLKSVLDVFFKQLNGLVKNAENIRPESYDVFASDGKKIDPAKYAEYKILKDEEFTIKLDIFDEKYFEKKNCSRKLTIQIGGYKEKKGGITYIKVPKDDKFETFFEENTNEELLKKMLKEELQKKVFINSQNIEFGDFSTNKDDVELSIKNLAKEDIKETKFVTTITAEAPKYFRSKGYICFDYSINKDSTLENAIKDISEFIKKEYGYSTAPVFESIKYGNGVFYIIDNNKNKIITPSKEITLVFKADGKINEDYISEQFPVVKFVNIELKQDNNYFALKKDVDDIIKEISPVYLHEDATCKDFLEKVTKQLRDKKNATNPPALSFKNKINVEGLVSPVVSDNLYLYLDPFSSSEYVENNKNFEGVYLYFKLKCGVDNYKLKNDYNNRDNALVVKDINNGKVTFKDLKKALEENYKIKSDQCNIYVNDNRELKDEDIISVTNFVVGITDSSLLDYLTPLEKMTFTIDYKYDTGFYKLTNDAPKELTVLITEEDLNKNIYSFISDHIITTIKNQNKDISYIYSYSLNNINECSYDSNEKVKDCIKKDEKNIVVLQLFEGCNLLEPKGKPKIEKHKKIGKKEEIKKEEENIDEEKSKEKSKEKPVGEPGKKSGKTTLNGEGMKNRTPGKTTLKSGDVKNSTEVKKGCCNNKCCKSKEEVESTEKKGCCCGRSRL